METLWAILMTTTAVVIIALGFGGVLLRAMRRDRAALAALEGERESPPAPAPEPAAAEGTPRGTLALMLLYLLVLVGLWGVVYLTLLQRG